MGASVVGGEAERAGAAPPGEDDARGGLAHVQKDLMEGWRRRSRALPSGASASTGGNRPRWRRRRLRLNIRKMFPLFQLRRLRPWRHSSSKGTLP